MKKLVLACLLLSIAGGVSACSGNSELKSPCVGAEKSPCERRPVNVDRAIG